MDLSLFTNRIINEVEEKTENNASNEKAKQIDIVNFIDDYKKIKNLPKANSTLAFQDFCRDPTIKHDNKLSLNELEAFLKLGKIDEEQKKALTSAVWFYSRNYIFFTKGKTIDVSDYAIIKKIKSSEENALQDYKEFINKNEEELFNIDDKKCTINNKNPKIQSIEKFLNTIDLDINREQIKNFKTPEEIIDSAKNYEPTPNEEKAVKNASEDAQRETDLEQSSQEAQDKIKGSETAEKEIESQQKGNEPSKDPEVKKAMDDVMGNNPTDSTLRSRVFNVAVPTLSAASGNAENDNTLQDFINKFKDAFDKKLKDYEKPFTVSLTHTDLNTNRAKLKKSESKTVKFESQDFFNKIILEYGLKDAFNEIGAIAGRRKNIYQMFKTEKEKLIDKKNSELKELEDKVGKLREKYHTSLKGQKRYALSFKIKNCYTNFLRNMEIAYDSFTKLMDPYLKTLRSQEVKSARKLNKIESKDKGLRGQFKEDEFNRAKEKLNALRGDNTYEKLAIVSLYKIVSGFAPKEHSDETTYSNGETETINYTNHDTESTKNLMAALKSGKNIGLIFCIPENVKSSPINKNVTKYNGYDFTDATVYDFSNCTSKIPLRFLDKVFDQETIKFIFSNPQIFNEIRKNDTFKDAYNKFMEGYDKKLETPKDKTASGSSVKNGEGLAASLVISSKGEFEGKPNLENPDYTELGFLSRITNSYKIVISLENGKSLCYNDKQWQEFQKMAANPEKPTNPEEIKIDEKPKQTADEIMKKLKKANKQKIKKEKIAEVKNRIKQAITNSIDSASEKGKNVLKNIQLKVETTKLNFTDVANALRSAASKASGEVFNDVKNLGAKINTILQDAENSYAKPASQQDNKLNFDPHADYNNWNASVNSENQEDNGLDELENVLNSISKLPSNISKNNNSQQTVQQNTTVPQQANSTVTTAAADSTYGNGYNYKPKRIREIIYKKGDYTVKTKEEI